MSTTSILPETSTSRQPVGQPPTPDTARAPATAVPFDRIPLVDFKGFRAGNPADKQRIAGEIGEALNSVGFFYLANHGIPTEIMDGVFRASKDFFAHPLDWKDKVSSTKTTNHRGYFPVGGENVDPRHTRDLKEGFDIGFEGPNTQQDETKTDLRGKNQWPDGLPVFRTALEVYYQHCVDLGRELCRAMALAANVDEATFDRNIEHSESRMRLLSYPPQPGGPKDERTFGAGAHTDCGCLTILAQDNIGGLAARNSAGQWIAADPIPGTLICNVGDMMEQWSGGRFASTVHRVINNSDRTRYSVALFFNPSFDVVVDGFKSLLGDGAAAPAKSTAGEYLRCCYDEIRSACQLP